MNALWRKAIQEQDDEKIRKARKGKLLVTRFDSLNDRANRLGLAIDMPSINREARRKDLKTAVREEGRKVK